MNFLQRTPFFRLLLPMICGIVTAQYLLVFNLTIIVLTSLSVLLMASSFFMSKTRHAFAFRWIFGIAATVFLFFTGYFFAANRIMDSTFYFCPEKLIYNIRIKETPILKKKTVACLAEVVTDSLYIESSKYPLSILYLQKDTNSVSLSVGDVLLIHASLQAPPPVLNPKGFDYAGYLQRKGISATAWIPAGRWKLIDHHEKFSLKDFAEKSRSGLLGIYQSVGLKESEFAVLAALTLGYKDALDDEVREDFSHSGAMHILAVSGLHVGVIYMILNMIFSLIFKKSKVINTVLILIFLWIYAIITGLPPSVIRAATMFSLVAIGTAIDRKSQIYNTIAVSAFIILLQNPDFLFDVGFQLSYSAVIGIIYFQPKIQGLLYVKSKIIKWLWDLTSVSLAAQVGTFPLALYYFHQFPNYFLLTNYLAIPLATLIIYIAVAFLALSWVPFISVILAFLMKNLLFVLNYAVGFVHDLPFAIAVIYINEWQLLLFALAIILFSFYGEYRKYYSLAAALVASFAFVLVDLLVNLQTLQSRSMVIFADRLGTHINLIHGKSNTLFTTDSTSVDYIMANFHKSRKLKKPLIKLASGSFTAVFEDRKILVLQDSLFHRKRSEEPFKTDFLVLGNSVKPRIEDLFSNARPEICIADQTINDRYAEKLRKACNERGVAFYQVSRQGAYIYDFKQDKP